MKNREVVIAELKRIADEHDGILRPFDIVEASRPKSAPLHSKFEWDDTDAAQRYREWQARQLISVTIEYIGAKEDALATRVFVSLTPDRSGSGGYRTIESVMQDPKSRRQLLADAMQDMERFRAKYEGLKELAEVFSAMRRIKTKSKKRNGIAA
jgi:hypothetical protein